MPNYIVLGNWTQQGIQNIHEAPNRIKTTHSMVEKAGGKMQLYYTMGNFDFIMVVELPSDDAMAEILLCLGSMGNVRTQTLKAWTEAEGAKLLSSSHP
ncbi:MAG: GYD domain-containing protein [Candidatus Bathyarchaeota archaeon]|nr:GYD domain-containing protein [Candidatus Bathyarchaeota archaeon]